MKKNNIFIVLFFLLSSQNYIFCETIGSDTTVSKQEHETLSGKNNRIAGFTAMTKGFGFFDQNTDCSFDSFFPVEKEININEGTLYLNKDLKFKGELDFINAATIYGNNYDMEFPVLTSTFMLPAASSLGQLNVVATTNIPQHIYTYHLTIDWSYDDKYVAIGIENELRIYSFDGISLTQVASTDLQARIYSLKFHPNNYDIVVGKSNGGPSDQRLEVRRFDNQNNTLNQTAHINPSMVIRSLEWHPTGNYIAIAGRRSNKELAIYFYSGSSLSFITETNIPGSGTRYFYEDTILSWRPDGQYLALGCRSDSTAPELFIHTFNGSNLTLSTSAETNEHIRSVDWSPTNSLIAIGLGGIPSPEKMRVYEHNADLNTLLEHQNSRKGYVDSCEGICWSPDGKNIVLGKDFNTGPEIQVFSIQPDSSLQLITGYERINHSIHRVEWSHNKKHIAAYSSDNILWVLNFNLDTSFYFNDTVLIFNSKTIIDRKTKFTGDCLIECNNNSLTFNNSYPIEVMPNSSLTIQNAKLFFDTNPSIHIDDSSTLKLINNSIDFPNGINLLSGPIEVYGKTDLSGTFSFPANFNDKSDTSLYRKITLTDSWLFRGTSSLNGRGITLDLLSTGSIIIDYDATLYLADIVLKGLGDNQLIFRNDNSKIYMSNVDIELEKDVTTTIGGIHVNGPTTFMLKNHNWTFDQNSSLTVDGTPLWKEPIDTTENLGNIKFGTGNINNYLSLINSGTIRYISNALLSSQDNELVIQNSNAILALKDNVIENSHAIVNNSWTIQALWERMPMIFKEHKIFDTGITHTVGEKKMIWFEGGFTVIPNSELNLHHEAYIYNPVALNETAKLTMVTNTYFASGITFTTGGLINASGNLLEFMSDVKLDNNKTLRFISDAVVDCNENSFELGNNAQLLIDNNVTLTLRNVKLKNLQDNFLSGIAMAENSYLALQNVELALSDNYTFSRGKLFIHNDVLISGTSGIIYQSNLECRIDKQALIKFDNGTSLVYAPATDNQNLIVMPNETSWLMLNDAELGTTFTPVQLTKGTLLIDGKVTFSNPGATQSEAIKFGDKENINNDLNVKILSGATINIDGVIVDQNVN